MIRLIASLLVLVSVSALADGRAHVIVVLKEQAVVDGTDIRVQDVAEVKTADADLAARVQALRVGTLPRDGLRRIVQRSHVLQVVANAGGQTTLQGEGAMQVVVESRAGVYPAAGLISAAREHLAQHLRRHYPALARVEIAAVGEVADLRVATGDVAVVARAINDARLARRVCVWLDVNVAGKRYRSLPVWMNVRAYAPVWVARRSFKPREKLEAGDFVQEERDVANLRASAVGDGNDLVGQRARNYIAAGAIARAADLEPNPLVLTAQEINVRVSTGSVLIETKAIAEEEGRLGEYIRVRNPSSASIFMAQVVGDKSVLVTER